MGARAAGKAEEIGSLQLRNEDLVHLVIPFGKKIW
jgi:hypothetical protein